MPSSTLALIQQAPEPLSFARPLTQIINLDHVSNEQKEKYKQKVRSQKSWRGKELPRKVVSHFEPFEKYHQVQGEQRKNIHSELLSEAHRLFSQENASQDTLFRTMKSLRKSNLQNQFNYNPHVATVINRRFYTVLEAMIWTSSLSADNLCMVLHHLISVAIPSTQISEKRIQHLIETILMRVRGPMPHAHSMRHALRKLTFAEVRCLVKMLACKFVPSSNSLFWISCIIDVHGRVLVDHEASIRYLVFLRKSLEAHQRVCQAVSPYIGVHDLVAHHRDLPTLYRDYELYHVSDVYETLTLDRPEQQRHAPRMQDESRHSDKKKFRGGKSDKPKRNGVHASNGTLESAHEDVLMSDE